MNANDPQPRDRRTRADYETPHLIRYGTIEDLTQGANAVTTNVADILSIQSGA